MQLVTHENKIYRNYFQQKELISSLIYMKTVWFVFRDTCWFLIQFSLENGYRNINTKMLDLEKELCK